MAWVKFMLNVDDLKHKTFCKKSSAIPPDELPTNSHVYISMSQNQYLQ
jgi:hypothetical protein